MAHLTIVRLDGGACSSVGYGPATDASVSAQPSEGHYIRRLGGLLAIRPVGDAVHSLRYDDSSGGTSSALVDFLIFRACL